MIRSRKESAHYAFRENNEGMLHSAFYAMAAISACALCFVAGTSNVAPLLGGSFLVLSVALVWRSRGPMRPANLIRFFFIAASLHALVGYFSANSTSYQIWIASDAERVFRKSFLIVAAMLFCSAMAYRLGRGFHWRKMFWYCSRLRVSDLRLFSMARIVLLLGAAGMAYVTLSASYLPFLASDFGAARYFTEDLSPDFLRYEWVMTHALDLLSCAFPLVVYSALSRRQWLDGLLGITGLVALIVPLRRANLVSVVVVLLLMFVLRGVRKIPKSYAVVLLALLVAYLGSQLLFLKVSFGDSGSETQVLTAFSAFPEIRDFGWVLSESKGTYFYGLTFLQPLIPAPVFLSDFKQEFSMGLITMRLAGFDQDRTMGGLRITLAGEGFLNFGFLAPAIVGLAFGLACAGWVRLLPALIAGGRLAGVYLASLVFVWLCMWLYMAGTQAAGVVRNGLILVAAMFFMAWDRKRTRHSGQREANLAIRSGQGEGA